MSTPVRADREDAGKSSPVVVPPPPNATSLKVTQELQLISAELTEALLAEQATLRREVLLWQQWVRFLALGALVLLTVVFGSTGQNALPYLALLSIAYVGVVAVTARVLRRNPVTPMQVWFPSLLLTADILTISGFMYLTSPPEQMSRVLLFGFLSMQLAVFYFGRWHGTGAAVLTAIAYLTFAIGVPAYVPGPRPTPLGVGFNVALYAFLCTLVVYTFRKLSRTYGLAAHVLQSRRAR